MGAGFNLLRLVHLPNLSISSKGITFQQICKAHEFLQLLAAIERIPIAALAMSSRQSAKMRLSVFVRECVIDRL